MSRLFDPENKFWNFIGKIADVTCMSFLWVGTSHGGRDHGVLFLYHASGTGHRGRHPLRVL